MPDKCNYLFDELPTFNLKLTSFSDFQKTDYPKAEDFKFYFPDIKKISSQLKFTPSNKKEGVLLLKNENKFLIKEIWLKTNYERTFTFDNEASLFQHLLECIYQQLGFHIKDMFSHYVQYIELPKKIKKQNYMIGYSELFIESLIKDLETTETIILRPKITFSTYSNQSGKSEIKKLIKFKKSLKEDFEVKERGQVVEVLKPLGRIESITEERDLLDKHEKDKKKDFSDLEAKITKAEAASVNDLSNLEELSKFASKVYKSPFNFY